MTTPGTLKSLALSSAIAIAFASQRLGSPAGDAADKHKLIDDLIAFSLYMIQHPKDLKTVYVVPMREAFRKAYPCSVIRQ